MPRPHPALRLRRMMWPRSESCCESRSNPSSRAGSLYSSSAGSVFPSAEGVSAFAGVQAGEGHDAHRDHHQPRGRAGAVCCGGKRPGLRRPTLLIWRRLVDNWKTVGFYAKHILPHFIDLAMRNPAATRLRAEWIPRATGDVLEIGIGSGLNLPFYTDRVRRVVGLDPSIELQRIARHRITDLPFDVEFAAQPAESGVPLLANTIDTVVLTWTLCSIQSPEGALDAIRRVLREDGQLIFIEHGWAPDADVQNWQNRLTPLWKTVAGGCHLNRRVETLLRQAGFQIKEMDKTYVPGPRVVTFTYRGTARQHACGFPGGGADGASSLDIS